MDKIIPDDAALAALDDSALLDLLAEHAIDTTAIGNREEAIAALVAKRDAPLDDASKTAIENEQAPAENQGEAGSAAEPTDEPPVEEPPAADNMVIDTTAEAEEIAPCAPRRTFGQVLSTETAAAFSKGDMPLHAAIHNFEMAAGDFKRAAQQLAGALPADSELAGVLESIISDL